MKKGLTTIFSLSLLLSAASPVFGACSPDKKKSTWDQKKSICEESCAASCGKRASRRLPDAKESAYRLTNAGIIAGLAFVADSISKEVFANALVKAPVTWITDTVPFMTSDRLAKVCAVLAAAAGGAWIIKRDLAKRILTLF